MYSLAFYKREQFHMLEKDWKRLERGGDMTLYQSYDWYEMLNKVYLPQDSSNYESVYITLKRNSDIVVIAPFWIILHTFKIVNKKGVYFIGRSGWSDYLNFIYAEFDAEGMIYLMEKVAERYKIHRFCLESFKENVKSYQFLRTYRGSRELGTGLSVAFRLPQTLEEYSKKLSKNTRQNIRTAHNRQKKDGKDLRVLIDDKFVDRNKCWEIREERFNQKFQKISRLRKIKYFIMRKLTFQFHSFLPFYTFPEGHFMTSYYGEELCSFFYYFLDTLHRQIIVIAAGVNSKYSKYSPGITSLFDFINYHIDVGDIDIIDFGIGDEKYKYSLGGQNQFTNGIEILI